MKRQQNILPFIILSSDGFFFFVMHLQRKLTKPACETWTVWSAFAAPAGNDCTLHYVFIASPVRYEPDLLLHWNFSSEWTFPMWLHLLCKCPPHYHHHLVAAVYIHPDANLKEMHNRILSWVCLRIYVLSSCSIKELQILTLLCCIITNKWPCYFVFPCYPLGQLRPLNVWPLKVLVFASACYFKFLTTLLKWSLQRKTFFVKE